MTYVSIDNLKPSIPERLLIQALDDDGDGAVDEPVWEGLADAASRAVDAPLSQSYRVPFAAPLPALVSEAARIFALEMIWQRRGAFGEANPVGTQADEMRRRLSRVGVGDEPLTATAKHGAPSVAVVTEQSRLAQKDAMLF